MELKKPSSIHEVNHGSAPPPTKLKQLPLPEKSQWNNAANSECKEAK